MVSLYFNVFSQLSLSNLLPRVQLANLLNNQNQNSLLNRFGIQDTVTDLLNRVGFDQTFAIGNKIGIDRPDAVLNKLELGMNNVLNVNQQGLLNPGQTLGGAGGGEGGLYGGSGAGQFGGGVNGVGTYGGQVGIGGTNNGPFGTQGNWQGQTGVQGSFPIGSGGGTANWRPGLGTSPVSQVASGIGAPGGVEINGQAPGGAVSTGVNQNGGTTAGGGGILSGFLNSVGNRFGWGGNKNDPKDYYKQGDSEEVYDRLQYIKDRSEAYWLQESMRDVLDGRRLVTHIENDSVKDLVLKYVAEVQLNRIIQAMLTHLAQRKVRPSEEIKLIEAAEIELKKLTPDQVKLIAHEIVEKEKKLRASQVDNQQLKHIWDTFFKDLKFSFETFRSNENDKHFIVFDDKLQNSGLNNGLITKVSSYDDLIPPETSSSNALSKNISQFVDIVSKTTSNSIQRLENNYKRINENLNVLNNMFNRQNTNGKVDQDEQVVANSTTKKNNSDAINEKKIGTNENIQMVKAINISDSFEITTQARLEYTTKLQSSDNFDEKIRGSYSHDAQNERFSDNFVRNTMKINKNEVYYNPFLMYETHNNLPKGKNKETRNQTLEISSQVSSPYVYDTNLEAFENYESVHKSQRLEETMKELIQQLTGYPKLKSNVKSNNFTSNDFKIGDDSENKNNAKAKDNAYSYKNPYVRLHDVRNGSEFYVSENVKSNIQELLQEMKGDPETVNNKLEAESIIRNKSIYNFEKNSNEKDKINDKIFTENNMSSEKHDNSSKLYVNEQMKANIRELLRQLSNHSQNQGRSNYFQGFPQIHVINDVLNNIRTKISSPYDQKSGFQTNVFNTTRNTFIYDIMNMTKQNDLLDKIKNNYVNNLKTNINTLLEIRFLTNNTNTALKDFLNLIRNKSLKNGLIDRNKNIADNVLINNLKTKNILPFQIRNELQTSGKIIKKNMDEEMNLGKQNVMHDEETDDVLKSNITKTKIGFPLKTENEFHGNDTTKIVLKELLSKLIEKLKGNATFKTNNSINGCDFYNKSNFKIDQLKKVVDNCMELKNNIEMNDTNMEVKKIIIQLMKDEEQENVFLENKNNLNNRIKSVRFEKEEVNNEKNTTLFPYLSDEYSDRDSQKIKNGKSTTSSSLRSKLGTHFMNKDSSMRQKKKIKYPPSNKSNHSTCEDSNTVLNKRSAEMYNSSMLIRMTPPKTMFSKPTMSRIRRNVRNAQLQQAVDVKTKVAPFERVNVKMNDIFKNDSQREDNVTGHMKNLVENVDFETPIEDKAKYGSQTDLQTINRLINETRPFANVSQIDITKKLRIQVDSINNMYKSKLGNISKPRRIRLKSNNEIKVSVPNNQTHMSIKVPFQWRNLSGLQKTHLKSNELRESSSVVENDKINMPEKSQNVALEEVIHNSINSTLISNNLFKRTNSERKLKNGNITMPGYIVKRVLRKTKVKAKLQDVYANLTNKNKSSAAEGTSLALSVAQSINLKRIGEVAQQTFTQIKQDGIKKSFMNLSKNISSMFG